MKHLYPVKKLLQWRHVSFAALVFGWLACLGSDLAFAQGMASIESILKHRLDEAPMPADVQPTLPLLHANLRGADYYH